MKLLRRLYENKNSTTLGLICMIAFTAMIVCAWIGIHQSVWFDEAYSIMVAKHLPQEIVRLAAIDTHPPLYYLLLHYWGELFDWNVTALRMLSVLAYGGVILTAGMLVRRLFGNRAALCAVVLAALSPLLMRYGFEIRMYALASFIGIMATMILIKAQETKNHFAMWLWLAYAVLVAVGVYTVYYLALLWIAHAVWLTWVSRRNVFTKNFWRLPWVSAYAVSIALFSPWLPTMLKQVTNGALAPIGQAMNTENLLGILSFNTLYQPVWQFDMLRSTLFLALIISLAMLGVKAYGNAKPSERTPLSLLVFYIAVPIIVLMAVSFTRAMYVERYLVHVAIGLMMMIGVAASIAMRHPSKMTYASITIIVLTCLSGIVQLADIGNFNFQRMQRPNVERVARNIVCSNDVAVVAADPYVMIELAAHLPSSCNFRFFSDSKRLQGGYAPLDQSPYQLTSVNIPPFAPTIYYAYYDAPKLVAPAGYRSQTQSFESISLMILRAA